VNETRIPIERIEANGHITEGTARARGVTIDDFRSLQGAPLELPAGASFVIPVAATKGTPDPHPKPPPPPPPPPPNPKGAA
jgi:hypothetical protein